jgi:hypothetical protein
MSFSRVYYAHANHAAKLLQLSEKDGGERGEIFVVDAKKGMFFALFCMKSPFFYLKLPKNPLKFAHVKKK